jgi:hypothetical protein
MEMLGHHSATVSIVAGLAWAALGGSLFFYLWVADRGLEITDEASYLLIAPVQPRKRFKKHHHVGIPIGIRPVCFCGRLSLKHKV